MTGSSTTLAVRVKPLIVARVHHAAVVTRRPSFSVGIATARQLSQSSVSSTTDPVPGATERAASSASPARGPHVVVSARPEAGGAESETAGVHSKTAGASSSSAAAAVGEQRPLPKTSSWLWRTIYLTVGAGTVALGAQYVNDPASIQTPVQKLYNDIDAQVRYFTEPSREKLLPDPTVPYPNAPVMRTLVVDLENTLVHSTYSRATGWRVAKRPGAEAFLAYMASFYEVVVFTSNVDTYADPILHRLDPHGYVAYRLYRAETHFRNGVHIKDISRLNRPIEKVVVIDHDERCVSMQRENAIIVPKWTGDPSDTALLDLIPLLEGIVREDVADVRGILTDMKGKPISTAVSEYRALAAARADRARGASLFGNVPPPSTPRSQAASDDATPQPALAHGSDDPADAPAGGLWRAFPSGARLFQQRSNGHQETQTAK